MKTIPNLRYWQCVLAENKNPSPLVEMEQVEIPQAVYMQMSQTHCRSDST